jgi:hypothetical protein
MRRGRVRQVRSTQWFWVVERLAWHLYMSNIRCAAVKDHQRSSSDGEPEGHGVPAAPFERRKAVQSTVYIPSVAGHAVCLISCGLVCSKHNARCWKRENSHHCFSGTNYISHLTLGNRVIIPLDIRLMPLVSGRTGSAGDQPDGLRHSVPASIALPEGAATVIESTA